MAGYDLEVDAPRFVPLDLELHICVKPGFFRSAVLAAIRDALSSTQLPDGRLGIFHPDNFTFGQSVYASRVMAAVQAVEGVESVRLDRFEKLADPDPATLEQGVIPIGRLKSPSSPTIPTTVIADGCAWASEVANEHASS